ncbi:MAG: phosphoglycerate dehydrogenase [Planctomycetota bacterium]
MTRLSFPKDRIRVVLLEGVHERAHAMFGEHGYDNVTLEAKALERDELRHAVADARLLGIRSRTHVDAALLASAPRLLAIGCFCLGTDQVDLDAAARAGVPVFHAPHANTRSVAELVLGFAVMLLRRVFPKSTRAHEGAWDKSARGCHELRGKTLGIVGYGHIGSQVSILAEAFGMRVLFHDIAPRLPLGNARPLGSLAEVLGQSDVVTLHVPDTEQTRGLVGAPELALMREDAYLINTSRGLVVDDEALARRLREGRLAGAAVDVFPREPRAPGERFESPLQGIHEVILTPHVGGSTVEAQETIAGEVARKLIDYSDLGTTTGAVNFPELGLTPHEGCSRVLHVHENRPGVLRQVNRVFADKGVNIHGEHLQTRDGVGYVVIDVDPVDKAAILPDLRAIEGTIRARILY